MHGKVARRCEAFARLLSESHFICMHEMQFTGPATKRHREIRAVNRSSARL